MSSIAVYAKQLIGRVEGKPSLDAGDRAKVSDPLIRPFKVIADQKAELDALKKASIGMVYVRKVGSKIILEPFDSASFENHPKVIDLRDFQN